LDDSALKDLLRFTHDLGLAPLVEVHSRPELDRAMDAGATLIGINNRDLKTFEVSLETTLELRQYIPNDVTLVAESGIHTQDDVARLADAGIDAMLVGESIVVAEDVGMKVKELVRYAPHPSPLPFGERGQSLLP
jgi:indole-3-glycerol phosphate synthase